MSEEKKVILHVRFYPDGSVSEIQDRPAGLAPQEWFNRLTNINKTGESFEALSGGRGVFRYPAAEIEALKAAALQ
ncbi:hypothetical protein [Methylocella silvestris]|uniref:Uncharacterized protein n=1 Tax=Methylocella silvestris TaxID=199596 RepID=A0A2J7TLP8_METSI|nr:hypothetical protein [Methylocella silvestris]PNG27689.1 hypothetical protein CR492_01905 [Methylocella silvestris]